MVRRGLFITLEGGEGVGKSTLARNLCAYLEASGHPVLFTREPGGTPVADALRSIFVTPPGGEAITIEAELCMVSAARAQHLRGLIMPALARGDIVLCDRFADSSRVYQGSVGGVGRVDLETIVRMTTFACEPDLTLILDCPIAVTRQRLRERSTAEGESRYDRAEDDHHEKIRRGFLRLAEEFPARVQIVNAAQEEQGVFAEARQIIDGRLKLARG